MSKDAFLYQINFNRKKYPEICKALEDAKADNGVAWYLRQLISRDIAERNESYTARPISTEPVKKQTSINRPTTIKPESIELPDDSGGFL